jgi:hypothetical protein
MSLRTAFLVAAFVFAGLSAPECRAASAPAVPAETEYHDFADEYVEFLALYADAGSEEEVESLRSQLWTMQSENPWLQEAVKTLLSAADSLEKDPKKSASAVLQSVLYVTKGLSDQAADGVGFRHRLTKEERAALLARVGALQQAKWIRSNETVMTAAGILTNFLKSDQP